MAIRMLGMMTVAGLMLGGCQTAQQATEARTKLACFQAGYGETSPRHAECMRTLLPVAQQIDTQRRLNEIGDGLALIAAGTQRR
ncbi:hypothetical protein [Bosea sp. NBC_00550]|uniref:hypothetical protein n=1 Tax=Bosea sp. NBC_00550 TaxID=2969621 RepID=UPI002231E9CC|nr:hypothetical protein [Bosea sp. NBC_00550]UZF90888.1 hypothetical protein NWE53_17300 [Bosea sp. NBC_00550]